MASRVQERPNQSEKLSSDLESIIRRFDNRLKRFEESGLLELPRQFSEFVEESRCDREQIKTAISGTQTQITDLQKQSKRIEESLVNSDSNEQE